MDESKIMLMQNSIEIEDAKGTKEISLYTHLFTNRKLFLTGEIDSGAADDFAAKLMYMEEEPDKPVTLIISGPGGEINAGLVIYDLLQATDLTINTYCIGMAASMSAVILAAGQKGRRFILPNSEVMIHEPLISNGVGGSATSIRNISESILKKKEVLNRILSKHTGKSLEEINAATAYDHYMTAEEAVLFGICDEIRNGISR